MPIRIWRMPASPASAITSSRIGTSMSSPSIEKRVLPGNVRWRKRSNASTCGQPVEQLDGIDRIGRRAEPAPLGRLPQPLALFGHEHVRVVVAGRRTIDAAERLDRVVAPSSTPSSGPATRFAGRLRRSSSVTPCVAARSEGSPIGGRAPSGSSLAARCPYRRIDSARLTAPTTFSSGIGPAAPADASSSDGGVHRSKSARVSGSTDDGSWRYFSYSSRTYPRLSPVNSCQPDMIR